MQYPLALRRSVFVEKSIFWFLFFPENVVVFLQHAWKNWVSEKGAANFVGPSFGFYIYILLYIIYNCIYIIYL
jgi:hypothetical protein